MRTSQYLRVLMRMNLRELGALRLGTLLQVVFMLLNNVVFFLFWVILYSNVEQIGGFAIEDVAFIFATAASGYGLAVVLFGGTRHLSSAVSSGRLDVYLTQPRDVQLQAITASTEVSGWGDILSALLLLGVYFPLDPFAWLIWLVGTVTGAVLYVSILGTIQCLIFWIPRCERLTEQLHEFMLGFALYPNTIFSTPVRVITFTLLPAGFIGYFPALARRDVAFEFVVAAFLASMLYVWMSRKVFIAGLRRYESGSAFTSVR